MARPELDGDRGPIARLCELRVADDPASWGDAGFSVTDGQVWLGETVVTMTGRAADQRGITGWSISGLDQPATATDPAHPADPAGVAGLPPNDSLDGLPTVFLDPARDPPLARYHQAHPNGVIGLDHVVISTPDLERTMAALDRVGLRCRRIRETTAKGAPMRQAFFRLGRTILEVVSGDTPSGQRSEDAPAGWFGLALDVEDLDDTAAALGDGIGPARPAVQPERRIATLRHRRFDLSVAVAVMDHHGDR